MYRRYRPVTNGTLECFRVKTGSIKKFKGISEINVLKCLEMYELTILQSQNNIDDIRHNLIITMVESNAERREIEKRNS